MGCFDKKQNNTFKFRSFAEQLADISVDVSRQVSLCRSATPSASILSDDFTSDTFFHTALIKWSELNFSLHYTEFLSELGSDVQSFTQLLLKKDHVVEVLVKHLYVADTMALQPLLELLTAFARDLSVDFYPIFSSRIAPLMYKHLLRASLPERLSWIFACLAHLYKLLWRPLVTNLSDTIDMYAAMVSGQKLSEHLTRFVAESFAFICRKSKDKLKLFTLVYDKLADNEKLSPLIGRLMFECMRGVRGRLHVDTSSVLTSQMELMSHRPSTVSVCVSLALTATAGHVTERQHAEQLWPPLWSAVLSPSCRSQLFSAVCSLLVQLVRHRSGSLTPPSSAGFVANCQRLIRSAAEMLTASTPADSALAVISAADSALSVISAVITCEQSTLSVDDIVLLHNSVLGAGFSCSSVVSYIVRLLDHPLFDSRFLPQLLLYIHRLGPGLCSRTARVGVDDVISSRAQTEEGSDDVAEMVVDLLCRVILHKRPLQLCLDRWYWSQQQQQCEIDYPLDFSFAIHARQSGGDRSSTARNSAVSSSSSSTWLWEYISARLSPPTVFTCRSAQLALVASHVLQQQQQQEVVVGLVVGLWQQRYNRLAERVVDGVDAAAGYSECDIMCRMRTSLSAAHSHLHKDSTEYNQLLLLTESLLRLRGHPRHMPHWRLVLKLLGVSVPPGQLQLLSCLNQLLKAAVSAAAAGSGDGEGCVDGDAFKTVFNVLAHNLASPYHKIRLLTLNILCSCCELTRPDQADRVPLSVLQLCLSAEHQPLTLTSYRERQRFLNMLEYERIHSTLPESYSLLPVLYLLGSLHVPFSLLWPVCSQLLIDHCRRMESTRLSALWSIVLTSAVVTQPPAADNDGELPIIASACATFDGGTSVSLCAAEWYLCEQVLPLDDRVDVCNYRLLLWKVTGEMSDALEPDGVDILASLFIDFVRDELCAGDLSFAQWQDLTCPASSAIIDSSLANRSTVDTSTSSRYSGGYCGRGGGEGRRLSAGEDDKSDSGDTTSDIGRRSKSGRFGKSAVVKKKGIVEVLCAHLTTMARLTQMRRSSAHSAQLCAMFERFLSHKRTDVQRAALQCLIAYRIKSLHLYSDLLLSLLDDSNFKSRLTGLNLSDSESADIKPAHRGDILPLLNRILYGRMRGSTGAGAASRDNSANRRRLVAGFLTSYSPQEIGQFLDLALDLFQHLPSGACDFSSETEGAMVELARAVRLHTCVSRAVPLPRLQSGVVLLSALVARLGRLLAPCLSASLLPRLVTAAAHVTRLLEIATSNATNSVTLGDSDRSVAHTVATAHIRILKKIRGMLLRCVRDLFEKLTDFAWSRDQLNALFSVCVRPSLHALLQQTASSSSAPPGGVTPVLRLLLTWANHERYMPLLLWRVDLPGDYQLDDSSVMAESLSGDSSVITKSRETPSTTLMSLLVQMMGCNGRSSGVTAAIMRAMETMLAQGRHCSSQQREEGREMAPLLPPGCQELVSADTVGVGCAVVLTVLPSLLDHIQSRVQLLSSPFSSTSLPGRAQQQLSSSEVHVLSAVCSLGINATEVPTSGQLFNHISSRARQMSLVLIGVLVSDKQLQSAEQRQLQLVGVLEQLVRVAECAHELIRPMTPLFSCLPSSDSHRVLVQCCQTILSTCSGQPGSPGAGERDWEEVCRLVADLNAVEGGRLQEPDYDRRLACFARVNAQLANLQAQVPDTFLRVLVHNCIWLLEHEDDMALRDNAVNTLEQLLMMIGSHVSTSPGPSSTNSGRQSLLQLLHSCILPLLRVRFRAVSDQLRHTCVRLLRVAVLYCSRHERQYAEGGDNQHGQQKISQLIPLCCVEDEEQDFFINIAHLQVARRGRALKRLLTGMESGQLKISADVFTSYVLPLANVYLFNDKYRKHTGLIDNAIKLVGVASSLMTWHQYQQLLRHYLRILPSCAIPRHAIRLIIAVLDKFPFRLSADSEAEIEAESTEPSVKSSRDVVELAVTEGEDDDMADAIETSPPDVIDTSAADITETSAADCFSARGRRQSALILRQLSSAIVPSLLRVLRTATTATAGALAALDGQSGEEERVVRVPLAVAVVKLFLHMPHSMQHQHIPNVVGSICELMLSREASCRSAALATLSSCLLQLCSSARAEDGWLGVFLQQLRTILSRGYQLHVLLHAAAELVITLNRQVTGRTEEGRLVCRQQLTECADALLQLCHMELFDLRSDSATVGWEGARDKFDKVPEAKGVKVYRIVLALSRHASEQSLYLIIKHLTQWTSLCRSEKACNRLRECYRQCQIGLTENTELPISTLLVLCHGLIARKITSTTASTTAGGDSGGSSSGGKSVFTLEDSRLIPETPTNTGKVEATVNEFILVEFGLSLLAAILRKQRAEIASTNLGPMIAPLMSHLTQYLQHSNVRVVSECLQCWLAVIKLRVIDLLSEHVNALRDSVFVTLHSYAAASSDLLHVDNHQLLASVFKLITGLVRDISSLRLTAEQLRLLLLHVESSLLTTTDPARRGSSGPVASRAPDTARHRRALLRHLLALLAAILSRRFSAAELEPLMRLVARTCVQSADGSSVAVTALTDAGAEDDNSSSGDVSGQTRALLLRYMLDYPLTRAQLDRHVTFVLQQLSYPAVHGRRAALHVCASICRQFPQSCLDSQCPLLFIYMASRLVSDTDTFCRRLLSRTVHTLLQRVSVPVLHQMADMCHKWLQQVDSHKIEQVTMAALLLSSVFFTAEISARLTSHQHVQLLSSLCRCIASSLAASLPPDQTASLSNCDMQMFQLVTAVRKLVSTQCHLLVESPPEQPSITFADQLWGNINHLLLHQHVWVRVAGGELLGQLLSSLDVSLVARALVGGASCDVTLSLPAPLRHDLSQFLRGLALDLCQQLFSQPLPEQLASQCTRNLVWLARVLVDADMIVSPPPPPRVRPPLAPPPEDSASPRLSLDWLVRRVRRCVNAEVRAVSTGTLEEQAAGGCRAAMFRWTAAVFAHCSGSRRTGSCHMLQPLLVEMMTPIARELNDAGHSHLQQLAQEVADIIKLSVGVENYTASLVEAQRRMAIRKNERKMKRSAEAVTNPAKTAQLKIKKNLKKNESRKRKLAAIKSVGFKRRKVAALS